MEPYEKINANDDDDDDNSKLERIMSELNALKHENEKNRRQKLRLKEEFLELEKSYENIKQENMVLTAKLLNFYEEKHNDTTTNNVYLSLNEYNPPSYQVR